MIGFLITILTVQQKPEHKRQATGQYPDRLKCGTFCFVIKFSRLFIDKLQSVAPFFKKKKSNSGWLQWSCDEQKNVKIHEATDIWIVDLLSRLNVFI